MQVEVKEICMCTEFGGCSLFGFRDFAPFQIWPKFRCGQWDKLKFCCYYKGIVMEGKFPILTN